MKTSAVGIFSIAILFVVTGIGAGIALAGGSHSERPVLSFADIQALEQSGPSNSYAENRPVLSFENERIMQAGMSPSQDMQLGSPVETGRLPSGRDADSAITESGGIAYRVEVDTGP